MDENEILRSFQASIWKYVLAAQACCKSDNPKYWWSCVRYCHLACINILSSVLFVQNIIIADMPNLWDSFEFLSKLPIDVDLSAITWMLPVADYFKEYFETDDDTIIYKVELETLLDILCSYMGLEKLNNNNYRKPFYVVLDNGANCNSSTYIIERSI